jgi:hypothetical protein
MNNELYEASLSRIWQHVQKAKDKSFSILTSWRQDKTSKENRAEFNNLKALVRGLGLGFIVVQGHWKECQDPDVPYDSCPINQLVDAVEPSLFVVGLKKDQAAELGSRYDQDAVVFAGPGTDGNISLLFKDGKTQDIGEFKPQAIGQAFTALRKSRESAPRHFKFEGVEYDPISLVEQIINEEIEKLLNV